MPKKTQTISTTILAILLLTAATAFPWPIPDTGQTKCYDNEKEIPCPKPGEPFYGQDGNYSINPMSYTKLDERGRELPDSASEWVMVRDNVTGLIWEVKTDDGSIHDKGNQYDWEASQSDFISRVNKEKFGGHRDWRLPEREELRTIVNYEQINPTINEKYFPKCISSIYWSSTINTCCENWVWYVEFHHANFSSRSMSHIYYARAVRDEHVGSFDSWVIHDDDTATDKSTGLMWQTSEPGIMSWEAALAYCEKLTLAGHSDWRLPTIKEIASLVKFDSFKPVADKKIFPNIVSSDYWSSTTCANIEDRAWHVSFSAGGGSVHFKSSNRYVRAVRGGQAGALDHLVIAPPKPEPQTITPPPPTPDTTPPTIAITEPQTHRGLIRRKTHQIPIKGIATDPSGIHQVLVNNQKAQLQQNGHFQTVALLKVGDNPITIQATDTHHNTATETFTITRAPDAPVPPPLQPTRTAPSLNGWYADQYALVVGIDAYKNPNIPRLRNAINDAKAVAQMFGDKMGFTVSELYGESATRTAIIRAIADVQQKAGKDDGFVFYFAGHGQGVRLKNQRLEGYIIPYDADLDLSSTGAILYDEEAISLRNLRTYAQDFSARHIALILDSCFSGLAIKRAAPQFPLMTADYYNDLLSRKAINILTAGDDHPVSDGAGHSPFTQALLYALNRATVDLHDRDGFATFNQLAVYVKEKVEKATGRRQRPQFDNLSMEDGEFVFRVR